MLCSNRLSYIARFPELFALTPTLRVLCSNRLSYIADANPELFRVWLPSSIGAVGGLRLHGPAGRVGGSRFLESAS